MNLKEEVRQKRKRVKKKKPTTLSAWIEVAKTTAGQGNRGCCVTLPVRHFILSHPVNKSC